MSSLKREISRFFNYVSFGITLIYLLLALIFVKEYFSNRSETSIDYIKLTTVAHNFIPIILAAFILSLIKVDDIIYKIKPLELNSEFQIFLVIQFVWHIVIWINLQKMYKPFDIVNISVKRSIILNLPILIWLFRSFVKKVYNKE